MQETRHQHEYSHLTTPVDTASSQGGTAIHLSLSHLMAAAVAVGISTLLAQQHVQPFPALLVVLAAATICGFLCTVPLQYGLYLLELTLSRLAHEQFHSTWDESNKVPSFTWRFPLGPLFLRTQEIEQRIQRYRTHARLTSDVREQALQQAREAAALAERNRIARELHDSIKQHIFGINASAAAARAYWQRENIEGAREAVGNIERSAEEAQVEMQALLQQLRPAPLENTSLLEALHTQAQALGLRTGARVEVDLDALPEQDRLLPGTQEAIFRLVQEAFANIARHAQARTIWLTLGTVEQTLLITVRDDGLGFDTAQVRTGMGLSNLRERTRALHGNVEINSQSGQGTTVLIIIPLLEALRSPAEEAHQLYELERANELARSGYQLGVYSSLLGMMQLMINISTRWEWNTFLSLGTLGALLVALSGWTRGVYYRARVTANTGRKSRMVLALTQQHYRASQGLLLLAGMEILFLFWTFVALGLAPVFWLSAALFLSLVGLLQFLIWRSLQATERYCDLLSTQEMGWELEKHQQAFSRALMAGGMSTLAIGLVFTRSLPVFPPITLAQLSAYGLTLIPFALGMGQVWHYRLIQRLKKQLRQRTNDQSTQVQEE